MSTEKPTETNAEAAAAWPLKLFRKSLLKQDKLKQLQEMLGSPAGKTLLDVGGDNGVVSLLLRQDGGSWVSADLSDKAVASMKKLLPPDSVTKLDGALLPFADNTFDAVVIIDYLEHVEEDYTFVQECHRVLVDGGTLIANVPFRKKMSLIRGIQRLLGLTDEAHGHVRPGYNDADMYDLLKDGYDIVESHTYSRFFVQLIDSFMQWGHSLVSGKGDHGGGDDASKGVLIDEEDFEKHAKLFKLISFVYPFLWIASKLDGLLGFTKGHMFIVKARCRPWKPRRGVKIADGRSIAEASLRTKIGTAAPF